MMENIKRLAECRADMVYALRIANATRSPQAAEKLAKAKAELLAAREAAGVEHRVHYNVDLSYTGKYTNSPKARTLAEKAAAQGDRGWIHCIPYGTHVEEYCDEWFYVYGDGRVVWTFSRTWERGWRHR